MDRLKSVLVAVDFSECSKDAFRQASRIAGRANATLTALHVVMPAPEMPPPSVFLPVDLPSTGDLITPAREMLERLPRSAGVTPRLEVAVGSPRSEIIEGVGKGSYDLLVMGAHGTFDAERGVGPTAAACAQRAPTKVLLVRPGHTRAFTNVVVCIDFTETSRLALEQGVRMAAQDGAALHILHVYEDPWHGLGPPDQIKANMPDFRARYAKAIEERLRAFCTPFAHELGALKAQYHTLQPESRGGHGQGIVAFATREGCDLVVLGTRGRWNLHDFLWGSTAERVVRSAPCSILAVKPVGDDQPAAGTN